MGSVKYSDDVFWSRADRQESGCLVWRKTCGKGYGRWRGAGAHQYAYAITKGAVPDGLELDHLCRNRACINPDHLEPVTHQENINRGATRNTTHCKNGHEINDQNTRVVPRGNGLFRICRRCNDEAKKKTAPEENREGLRHGNE